jgi:hypothetical protein
VRPSGRVKSSGAVFMFDGFNGRLDARLAPTHCGHTLAPASRAIKRV